jgi:drug/metabolite transporter (DMT)-like permease
MPAGTLVGIAALLFNALVWGVSWWPMRWLQGHGLHPLFTTVVIYALAVAFITLTRPKAWGYLFNAPVLWVLVLASGFTNAGFNWAVTVGDVVRVVLLFYLMPVWAVLLARWLLNEPLTARALARVGMAVAGAAVVLWAGRDPSAQAIQPSLLADALAVAGGLSFALNNVMLRREQARPAEARALAMFLGGVLVAGLAGLGLVAQGLAPAPTLPAPVVWGALLALSVLFLLSNLALQVGAGRLSANVTAVVMITEVLFAAVSALLLDATAANAAMWLGGALIVAAAMLAALRP